MHIPQTPPNVWSSITPDAQWLRRLRDADVVDFVRRSNDGYIHWDKLRFYKSLPENFDAAAAWAAITMSRFSQYQQLPVQFANKDSRVVYWIPPQQLQWLHEIDQQAGGSLGSSSIHVGANDSDKDKYLINALMEEAIASSQLEGAVTTRKLAKQMLREGRQPRSKAERMIFNNYRAIQKIRECRQDRLTPELIKELHSILTTDTLNLADIGKFRQAEDNVVVEDSYSDDTLHYPPPAESVEERIQELCQFANQKSKPFVHPVIKAIVLHFAIGYVHPFVDGNGRAARAMFYWYMLREGYWLFEFLPISRLFFRAPASYARAYLYTEHDNGDATYFVHYNLRVIIRAIKELHEYLAGQQQKIAEAARLLESADLNHRQQALIYHALKHPDFVYTIQQYKRTYNVSYGTAHSDLTSLSNTGYLQFARKGKQMDFRPHGELLRKLRKVSSISSPMPRIRKLPPIAVTRIQNQ